MSTKRKNRSSGAADTAPAEKMPLSIRVAGLLTHTPRPRRAVEAENLMPRCQFAPFKERGVRARMNIVHPEMLFDAVQPPLPTMETKASLAIVPMKPPNQPSAGTANAAR